MEQNWSNPLLCRLMLKGASLEDAFSEAPFAAPNLIADLREKLEERNVSAAPQIATPVVQAPRILTSLKFRHLLGLELRPTSSRAKRQVAGARLTGFASAADLSPVQPPPWKYRCCL